MPAENTTLDGEYALELVRKICAEVGPGLPGTPQERQRAELIKDELRLTWVQTMWSLKNSA